MALKEDITAALVSSAQEAFKTMLSLDLVAHDRAAESVSNAEFVCTIGLTGKIEGGISVAVSNQSACHIVSKMLGMDITEMSADVCDGMGEVANLIAGGIKMRAAGLGYSFDVSIPTVVQGKLMSLSVAADLDRIVRQFDGDGFSFDVEFIFKVAPLAGAQASANAAVASKLSAFEKLKAMTAK